ncbi:solute carrier organic anion transporter family member 2B1-like [Physella acuta]|uniref:solute carrier organic anion transporter family member 2B1-like n=1 Tax=Physella acuta TaxID=109671 RepID=UPI0027DD3A19|nr:solute carrier organic anion transporter family member 2B1-like [Physella acuta]
MDTTGHNPEVTDDTGRGTTADKNKNIYRRIWWFSLLYNLTNMVTSVMTTYIRSQITTLEKQFGFNSKQLGLIVSSTELGFLLYATCVCCSSCKVHIPRILGLSTVLFGLSCLFCSVPHFLYGAKNNILGSETNETNQIGAVCSDQVPAPSCKSGAGTKSSLADDVTLVSLGILVLGKVVQGLVQSPRSVLFCNYVTGMQERELLIVAFVALIMTSVISHPLGYILGGVFSQIYVTLQDTPWTVTHPQWIGAWWLGLVMFGVVTLLLATPMFCYPRDLTTREVGEQHARDGQGSLDKNSGLASTNSGGKKCSIESKTPRPTGKSGVKQGFLNSLCRLLTTPVYLPRFPLLLMSSADPTCLPPQVSSTPYVVC